jgi:peptide/nickel transport system substrate-binding protein
MNIFSKIKGKLSSSLADWRTRRHIENIDRSDVLLAHHVVTRRRFPSLFQWRLIGRVLAPREKRLLSAAAGMLTLGLAAIAASWAFTHAIFVPAAGGEYREGVVGSPRAPNPILAGNKDIDRDIVSLAYSGIYRRDEQGRLALDLAQSVEISPDGKTYVFKLKNGIVFHDGTPLTSDDVIFTIQAIQAPSWKSPLAPGLIGIAAKTDGAQTVVISSNKPLPYLPSLLTFGILPKHVWSSIDSNSRAVADFSIKPIGTGPYRFEKFTRDQQGNILTYTLRRAKDSPAKIERITFKFYDDYDTAADKLTSNSVDGLSFVPPGKLESVKTIPGIIVRAPRMEQYTAIFLNPRSDSALVDPIVRQALARAIDRQKIISSALGGLARLRDQPLSDGTASNSEITRYPYDPAAAGALLDKAGYPLAPETGIRGKTVTSKPASKKEKAVTTTTALEISLATIDTEDNRRVAEIIKTDWEKIGVKTDVILASAQDIQKSVIKPRAYDALLIGEVLATDSDSYPFWHSSQSDAGLNLASYSNRRVDELLEKAQFAINTDEQKKFLAEFQQIITRDEPAIFLYQPDYLYPQSNKIKGFAVAAITSPSDRFANITAWYRRFRLSFK